MSNVVDMRAWRECQAVVEEEKVERLMEEVGEWSELLCCPNCGSDELHMMAKSDFGSVKAACASCDWISKIELVGKV